MNVAIITGASSGIGKEFVLQMDQGFPSIDEFWLVARDEEKLKETASNLTHKTRIFAMDLTKMGQLQRLEYAVKLENAKICILIGSAGTGKMGPFSEIPLKEELNVIHLNCMALTEMTHRLLPYLRKNARIILLSSGSAFLPQPDFAVYAASKSYVLSFARALSHELSPRNIYVTAVCPGPVDTPFLSLARETGETLAIKKYFTAEPKEVVAKALRDSWRRKTVSVYGISMKSVVLASKLFPHEVILKVMDLLKGKES